MSSTKAKGKNAKWNPAAETVPALVKVHGNIKQKCSNPNDRQYKNYGKRGISFHPGWATDKNRFVKEIIEEIGLKPSKSHSLDRKDNEGNYEPGNLRWASKQEQAINRRSSATVLIKGTEMRRADLANELGLRPDTLGKRLRHYPRSNPRVIKFEDYWLKHMSEMDRLPVGFTHNERRLVAEMIDRLPDGLNLAPAVRYDLHCWEDFAEEAAEAGGLRTYPKQPRVDFFTVNIGTAVSFGKRKLAKTEADRARQLQAQLEREADARAEKIEAEAMDGAANEYFERLKQRNKAGTGLHGILQSIALEPSGPETEASSELDLVPQKPAPEPKPSLPAKQLTETAPQPSPAATRHGANPVPYAYYEDGSEAEWEEIISLGEPEEAEPCN